MCQERTVLFWDCFKRRFSPLLFRPILWFRAIGSGEIEWTNQDNYDQKEKWSEVILRSEDRLLCWTNKESTAY